MANIIIRLIITIFIIFGALHLAKVIIGTKKDPKSKQPPTVIPQVDTIQITKANYRLQVRSFGNIQSYFETTLSPQINGLIVSVSPNFRVGQKVAEGEILATIDQTNYKAALATQKANLILQQSTLAEEKIRAKQAAADWKASGRKLSTASEFVLRKPQLAAAKANIDSVMAAIAKAEADIQRTKIQAPYNAIVTERNASLGNYANAQSSLGKLVATEKAEVRIPLTAEQMERIQFDQQGGKNPILTLISPSNPELTWKAELTQMEPTVDLQNQVRYAIGTIKNPYSSKTNPLSVGSFVNVLIPAIELKDAYKVPESALVNDSYLWVVDENDQLLKVEVTRDQSEDSFAFVRVTSEKSTPAIRIITRPLSTFRSGMKVKWKKDKDEQATNKN